MKRLLSLGCWLALTACGHPPIEAHSIPKPVLIGPIRHLPALDSPSADSAVPLAEASPEGDPTQPRSPQSDAARRLVSPGGTQPFSFTSIVATTSYATGPNTASGSTTTTRPGSFGAAVDYASAGYPDARLEIETITCVARFSFPLFYANSTERCSVDGSLTLGERSPDAARHGPRHIGPND